LVVLVGSACVMLSGATRVPVLRITAGLLVFALVKEVLPPKVMLPELRVMGLVLPPLALMATLGAKTIEPPAS
jgi:hypothetical protein